MAYIDTYNLYHSSNLRNRTTVAIVKAAQYVIAGGGSPTPEMVAYARNVMQAPETEMLKFIWYVIGDPAVTSEAVADSVIQTVVDTNYPALWG